MAGAFGYQAETYDVSMKMAERPYSLPLEKRIQDNRRRGWHKLPSSNPRWHSTERHSCRPCSRGGASRYAPEGIFMSDTVLPFAQPDSESRSSDGSTLHSNLVANIRELIVEGDLEPGAKVPERILSERYGVSRNTASRSLKDAGVRRLAGIAAAPGRSGCPAYSRGRRPNVPDYGGVECASCLPKLNGRSVRRNSGAALSDGPSPHAARIETVFPGKSGDPRENTLRLRKPVASAYVPDPIGRIRRARYVANMSSERWSQAVKEHEEMLNALAARDGLGRRLKAPPKEQMRDG